MNLKAQRLTLIIVLLMSLTIHLIYGLEGVKQMGELEYKLERQAAQLKDKQEQIEVLTTILEHQEVEEDEELKETCLGEYTITAYCGCEICCGKYALNRPNGIVYGASGEKLIEGVSVASPLQFRTKIIIDGHEYISQDSTADWIVEKYNSKIIDLYFENHEDAQRFGKQVAKVYLVGEEK